MEESLIEFEEKKKTCTGPKACQKVKVKAIRGHKDIRTLFKKKESDLVTFTKDFNKVCLKNGIDVDSQQLQLAIALSKSLQPPNQIEAENIQTGKFVSSFDRSNKIHRTLQEYGFKVSGPNIKSTANRRGKTHRKSYKLLLATEEEKSQKINEKYTQVLYDNPCKFIENDELDCKIVENGLFYLATNITYKFMKNSEIFYISKILCEISNTKGNLLKNWADIPGRPSSPIEREDFIISFLDMECTQAELDIMLSGTLKAVKDICRLKIINNSAYIKDENIKITSNFMLNVDTSESIICSTSKETVLTNTNYENNDTNIKRSSNSKMFFLSPPRRSQSPDIFGEEDTIIIDDNVKRKSVSENIVNILPTFDFKGYEDSNIDQCTPPLIQNLTKRKTNDFMDLTECIPVAVQKFEDKFKSNIKSTSEFPLIQDNMEITECVNHISLETDPCAHDLIDLTQHVDNSFKVKTKKTVAVKENFSTLDLTQSSNSDDDLLPVEIYGTQKISSEDAVVVNYDDYFDTELTQKRINCVTNEQSTSLIFIQEELKDNLCENENVNMEEIDKEDVLGHTSFSYDLMMKNSSANNCEKASVEYIQDESEDIDLTQSSDSRLEISDLNFCTENTNNIQSIEYNHLGKKDNISIDYDDIHQGATVNMYSLDEKFNSIYSKNANVSKTVHIDEENTKNGVVINCSNTSECFDVSNQELIYSTKPIADIFDVNKTLPIEKFCNINNMVNVYSWNDNFDTDRSTNESCVLSLDVNYNKGSNDIQQQNETHISLTNSTCSSPIRAIIRDGQISMQTPTHSEYVIKTGNITPMLDYGAMGSPERNRELEKYGLKPFKRKRAIQLLTHLYNQTHPIIEYCSEEPVLAKKFKLGSYNSASTINESVDKDKDTQDTDMDRESIYRQTKDVPDIRNIECSDEDWVFQKKEKAKVHTCRVPLHIAFHNYVSCRRALRESILRYEPINIDVIHKDLISNGYKYNPKDLLKFLDKRCITVKTADNNGRNSKK